MAWLGVLTLGPNSDGPPYNLFVFEDGLVVVKASVARALSAGLIRSEGQNELGARLEALGPDVTAIRAVDILPRSVLIPLDDIEAGEVSGMRLKITTRSRRSLTAFRHTLHGRLRSSDLDTCEKMMSAALGGRWNGSVK